MFQTLSKKLKNRKGFTLIELIVVLAILGIILAIAVPNYLGVQESSAVKADASSQQLAEKAVKLWLVDNNVTQHTFTIECKGTDTADPTYLALTGGTVPSTADQGTLIPNYLENNPTAKSSANSGLVVTITVTGTDQVITSAWTTPTT